MWGFCTLVGFSFPDFVYVSPLQGLALALRLGVQGAHAHEDAAQVVLCKHDVCCDLAARLVCAHDSAGRVPLLLSWLVSANAAQVLVWPLKLALVADNIDTWSEGGAAGQWA